MKFIEHSDDWSWMPPIPFKHWVGWWISNDDGEPIVGPFETKAEAEEELAEVYTTRRVSDVSTREE